MAWYGEPHRTRVHKVYDRLGKTKPNSNSKYSDPVQGQIQRPIIGAKAITMIKNLIWIRSWIYLFTFLTWTAAIPVVCLPALIKKEWALAVTRFWVRGVMTLAKYIVGVHATTTGQQNLPQGACIIAAQHQSSYETYRMFLELESPIFILKRELVFIPLIGWFMKRFGLIGIDRNAGAGAMRKILREAQAALDSGNQLVIFPEGTRTAPGIKHPYQPGVAALYAYCDAPVIPMALNSGFLWGKTRLLKLPGTIEFRFLPPLRSGMDKDTMLKDLRKHLDSAAEALGQV